MTTELQPTEILDRQDVRRYFLSILDSPMSSVEKYQCFIDFFDVAHRIHDELSATEYADTGATRESDTFVASSAAREAHLWDPSEVLEQTQRSIRSALEWLHRVHRDDGGWGYRHEPASVWATAHVILALLRADDELKFEFDRESHINEAIGWLDSNQSKWAILQPIPAGGQKTFEAALAIRALIRAEDRVDRVSGSLRDVVDKTVLGLVRGRNRDGAWHVRIGASLGAVEAWSDTGATSVASRAIAAWGRRGTNSGAWSQAIPSREVVDEALDWLIDNATEEGIWRRQFLAPDGRLEEVASVTKTCDAINALLTGCQFVGRDQSKEIETAVKWVLDQESLLLNDEGRIRGWGYNEAPQGTESADAKDSVRPDTELYEDYARKDLNCTCLALETLVRLDSVPLPALWANARWLIGLQQEDGEWREADTFRITSGLIHFCRRVKEELSRQVECEKSRR